MTVIRFYKRKWDFKFPGYKRWQPIEKFLLMLMIIAFIAQFYLCIVLPRDFPSTHTYELKGSFKRLQHSFKQTEIELKGNDSALQRLSSRPSIIKYILGQTGDGVLRQQTNHISSKLIKGDVPGVLRPSIRPTSTKQIIGDMRNDVTRPTGTKQTPYFQRTNARNLNRLLHLKDQCKPLSKIQTKSRNPYMRKDIVRIVTSSSLAIVYCRVNKAASWYTMRLLQNILNCNEECLRRSSQRIRSLSYARKKDQIKNSFKFLFVREPYGRLFSTYCNKFYFPKGIWDPIGIDIIRRYRKDPSEESLKYGYDVTFAELVRFTADEFEAGNKMDAHIRPMYSNCKPCDYDYDFIGKLETFQSDMEYLAHEWKARNITTNVPNGIGEKFVFFEEMSFVRSFLESIRYSKIDMYNLYKRAWNYYQITSVISKHVDMPYSRSDNIKFYSFVAKLKEASVKSSTKFPDMKGQKYEALLQAYSTIPMKDLERLKNVVREDCLLFGYDASPSWLFGGKLSQKMTYSFNYFSGIGTN